MAESSVQQLLESAVALHRAGRLVDAERIYRQILQHQPDHDASMHLLGVVARDNGRTDEAIALIRGAIAINPAVPGYFVNLGNALRDQGRLEEAMAAYRQALAIDPDFTLALNNLADTLLSAAPTAGLDEVIALSRRALRLQPGDAPAVNNLGIALCRKGELEKGIAAYRSAIALNPNYARAWTNLGNALKDKRQFPESVAAHRRSIALDPRDAVAHTNLGAALQEIGEHDEALRQCRRAVELDPNNALAQNNLGFAFKHLDNAHLAESIVGFRRAIALQPDFARAHYNLALSLLLDDQFQQGWVEHEWRLKDENISPERFTDRPRWKGENLAGKSILLYAEQGLGDTIQFARYIPPVAQQAARVLVECQPHLICVLRSILDPSNIIPRGRDVPPTDFQSPLMSLPLVFDTRLESVPDHVPYLHPDPQKLAAWREKLAGGDGRRRVGLAWAGNPNFPGDRTRSLTLDKLAPFAQVRNVRFYSIQKGSPAEQLKNPPRGLKLVNLGPGLNDLADTVAVMSLMDLIVSTDTSLVHLAGALARPLWVMLQFIPDFRWLLEREDNPWYPTMRLFRQSTRGDWDQVIQRVAQALAAL
jgi:tetratricopeptide (TPR) repeat protein